MEHFWVLILVLIWTVPWKGWALWRAARAGHLGWFTFLLIFNTLAILDIIYIFLFSEDKSNHFSGQSKHNFVD